MDDWNVGWLLLLLLLFAYPGWRLAYLVCFVVLLVDAILIILIISS